MRVLQLHLLLACIYLNVSLSASFLSLPVRSNSKRMFGHTYQRPLNALSTTAVSASNNNNNNNGPKFCEQCGTPTTFRVPSGDERERACCSDPSCGFVSYQNPKVVVAAICMFQNKVLLCKRAIEPCAGKWGFPQGFMELGETTREGAVRETWEEAGVTVDPADARLLAVYNLAGAQVQMVFAAPLASDELKCGVETEEAGFYGWDEIPWDQLAFPTVQWALEYARDNLLPNGEMPPTVVPQQRTKIYFDGTWDVVDDL